MTSILSGANGHMMRPIIDASSACFSEYVGDETTLQDVDLADEAQLVNFEGVPSENLRGPMRSTSFSEHNEDDRCLSRDVQLVSAEMVEMERHVQDVKLEEIITALNLSKSENLPNYGEPFVWTADEDSFAIEVNKGFHGAGFDRNCSQDNLNGILVVSQGSEVLTVPEDYSETGNTDCDVTSGLLGDQTNELDGSPDGDADENLEQDPTSGSEVRLEKTDLQEETTIGVSLMATNDHISSSVEHDSFNSAMNNAAAEINVLSGISASQEKVREGSVDYESDVTVSLAESVPIIDLLDGTEQEVASTSEVDVILLDETEEMYSKTEATEVVPGAVHLTTEGGTWMLLGTHVVLDDTGIDYQTHVDDLQCTKMQLSSGSLDCSTLEIPESDVVVDAFGSNGEVASLSVSSAMMITELVCTIECQKNQDGLPDRILKEDDMQTDRAIEGEGEALISARLSEALSSNNCLMADTEVSISICDHSVNIDKSCEVEEDHDSSHVAEIHSLHEQLHDGSIDFHETASLESNTVIYTEPSTYTYPDDFSRNHQSDSEATPVVLDFPVDCIPEVSVTQASYTLCPANSGSFEEVTVLEKEKLHGFCGVASDSSYKSEEGSCLKDSAASHEVHYQYGHPAGFDRSALSEKPLENEPNVALLGETKNQLGLSSNSDECDVLSCALQSLRPFDYFCGSQNCSIPISDGRDASDKKMPLEYTDVSSMQNIGFFQQDNLVESASLTTKNISDCSAVSETETFVASVCKLMGGSDGAIMSVIEHKESQQCGPLACYSLKESEDIFPVGASLANDYSGISVVRDESRSSGINGIGSLHPFQIEDSNNDQCTSFEVRELANFVCPYLDFSTQEESFCPSLGACEAAKLVYPDPELSTQEQLFCPSLELQEPAMFVCPDSDFSTQEQLFFPSPEVQEPEKLVYPDCDLNSQDQSFCSSLKVHFVSPDPDFSTQAHSLAEAHQPSDDIVVLDDISAFFMSENLVTPYPHHLKRTGQKRDDSPTLSTEALLQLTCSEYHYGRKHEMDSPKVGHRFTSDGSAILLDEKNESVFYTANKSFLQASAVSTFEEVCGEKSNVLVDPECLPQLYATTFSLGERDHLKLPENNVDGEQGSKLSDLSVPQPWGTDDYYFDKDSQVGYGDVKVTDVYTSCEEDVSVEKLSYDCFSGEASLIPKKLFVDKEHSSLDELTSSISTKPDSAACRSADVSDQCCEVNESEGAGCDFHIAKTLAPQFDECLAKEAEEEKLVVSDVKEEKEKLMSSNIRDRRVSFAECCGVWDWISGFRG